MERFLTRYCVAVTKQEAIRLAQLDGTPFPEIVCTNNVELIHVKRSYLDLCSWAWWSDSQLTTANGLPEGVRIRELTPDAVKLITLALEGNPHQTPTCSWKKLASVKEIINIKKIATDVIPDTHRHRFVTVVTAKSCHADINIYLIAISGNQQEMPFCQFYEISVEGLKELLATASIINIDKLLEKLQHIYCGSQIKIS